MNEFWSTFMVLFMDSIIGNGIKNIFSEKQLFVDNNLHLISLWTILETWMGQTVTENQECFKMKTKT
jgi:hypothetical protein